MSSPQNSYSIINWFNYYPLTDEFPTTCLLSLTSNCLVLLLLCYPYSNCLFRGCLFSSWSGFPEYKVFTISLGIPLNNISRPSCWISVKRKQQPQFPPYLRSGTEVYHKFSTAYLAPSVLVVNALWAFTLYNRQLNDTRWQRASAHRRAHLPSQQTAGGVVPAPSTHQDE